MTTLGETHATTGLTAAQVAERVAAGQVNVLPDRSGRSVLDIVRANVLTRINAILGVLFIIVMTTGSIINGAFGLLIIANSGIGIIQEIRAKRTLDALAIVGQTRPMVRRMGWPPRSRRARWCSATSSNWGPGTRSLSTAKPWKREHSTSTNRC